MNKGNTLVPVSFTPAQVAEMLSVAHAVGWNDGRNKNITWSDTSRERMEKQILELFNINLQQ